VRGLQKLFVSNLPWTVGSNQLKKYVQEECGRVFNVNVVFDKKTGVSQRYAFINVPKETLVNIERKDRHRLEGNNIFFQSSN